MGQSTSRLWLPSYVLCCLVHWTDLQLHFQPVPGRMWSVCPVVTMQDAPVLGHLCALQHEGAAKLFLCFYLAFAFEMCMI